MAKRTLVFLIEIYRMISFLRRGTCVFYPTCSKYGMQAIEKYGAARGLVLLCRRVLRCHPRQKNRIDEV